MALRNTALGCSIIQGLKLLRKWFKSTDCLPSFLSASVPWVLSSEHQPQPGPASCRHEEQLGYLSRFCGSPGPGRHRPGGGALCHNWSQRSEANQSNQNMTKYYDHQGERLSILQNCIFNSLDWIYSSMTNGPLPDCPDTNVRREIT